MIVMPGDQVQVRPIQLDGTGDHWAETGSGLVVPTYAAPAPPPRMPIAVDLFAGCGGFSLGFHQAGWDVAVANEWDVDATMTYLANFGHPDQTLVVPLNEFARKMKGAPVDDPLAAARPYGELVKFRPDGHGPRWADPDAEPWGPPCRVFFFGDVRLLTGDLILQALDLDEVDCVFGGPPCQGFSTASGRKASDRRHDPRNELVFEFVRLVLECRSKTFVMENVPALLTMLTSEGVPVIDAISRVLADGGFGTFDALRRSLRSNADAGGAVRNPTSTTEDGTDDPAEDDGAQLNLFAEAGRPTP